MIHYVQILRLGWLRRESKMENLYTRRKFIPYNILPPDLWLRPIDIAKILSNSSKNKEFEEEEITMESHIINDIAVLQDVIQGVDEAKKKNVIYDFARKYCITKSEAEQIARNEMSIKEMVGILKRYK